MKVKVDGTIYEAYPGETVLKLCRRIGIEIPTLCFDERLEPFTSCWVCLVEVKNRRGLSPACGIYLESGMEIRTRGEDIFNARKTAIELLLSTHFGDCYPPCTLRCPSNVDIQGYIGLVGSGKYIDAVNLIRKTNPFPSICGRVCTRPCEESCRRNILDMPVGIDYIKRFAADLELENPSYFIPPRKPSTGYKIALIGAGPASLTAAYYLSLNGHKTTVFEAEEEPGGTMRYGIPPYRLPRDVIK
ncbi:MAG: 2Fe-2S iron-sulfur cluster-binding protein, partial [bacterium]